MDYKSPLRIAMEKAMNGEQAFTRENPEPWETKHYFMKWPDDPFSTASDAQIIDVPDDIDPEEFRLNGYKRPSRLSSASFSLQTATPTLSNKNIFDNPPGYQSLLPENNATLSKTSHALTNTSTDLLSGGLKGSLTSNFSTLNNPSNSSFSNESSLFSTSSPYQNDPLWEQLNSYSDEELSELTDMMNQTKDEERLYENSPTKQNLLDHLFAIKQAHAGTLSSQGIENETYQFSGFEPYKNKQQALFQNTFEEENSLDSSIDQLQQKKQIHTDKSSDFTYQTLKSTGMLNNLDLTDDINRHMDALKAFEGRTRRIYFDSNGNPTIGIGKLIDDYQIDKDNIWILTPEQKTQLKADLEMIKHHFNPKTGGLKNLSSNKQIQIFEDLVRGKDVATVTDGKIKSLSSKELEAFKRIYSYQLTGNRPEELVHEHFAIIKPAIEKFLKQNKLKWHELNNAQKDMILDISYNPGVPLSSWTNFGESLRYNNPGATGVETHRKGIQVLRNNYNLLRGLPEFKNLSPQELINKLQVFGNIELTKDNVNFYMNKLGIKTNPFKERESWEFERFVKRL